LDWSIISNLKAKISPFKPFFFSVGYGVAFLYLKLGNGLKITLIYSLGK
jgi:hypothetical protein